MLRDPLELAHAYPVSHRVGVVGRHVAEGARAAAGLLVAFAMVEKGEAQPRLARRWRPAGRRRRGAALGRRRRSKCWSRRQRLVAAASAAAGAAAHVASACPVGDGIGVLLEEVAELALGSKGAGAAVEEGEADPLLLGRRERRHPSLAAAASGPLSGSVPRGWRSRRQRQRRQKGRRRRCRCSDLRRRRRCRCSDLRQLLICLHPLPLRCAILLHGDV